MAERCYGSEGFEDEELRNIPNPLDSENPSIPLQQQAAAGEPEVVYPVYAGRCYGPDGEPLAPNPLDQLFPTPETPETPDEPAPTPREVVQELVNRCYPSLAPPLLTPPDTGLPPLNTIDLDLDDQVNWLCDFFPDLPFCDGGPTGPLPTKFPIPDLGKPGWPYLTSGDDCDIIAKMAPMGLLVDLGNGYWEDPKTKRVYYCEGVPHEQNLPWEACVLNTLECLFKPYMGGNWKPPKADCDTMYPRGWSGTKDEFCIANCFPDRVPIMEARSGNDAVTLQISPFSNGFHNKRVATARSDGSWNGKKKRLEGGNQIFTSGGTISWTQSFGGASVSINATGINDGGEWDSEWWFSYSGSLPALGTKQNFTLNGQKNSVTVQFKVIAAGSAGQDHTYWNTDDGNVAPVGYTSSENNPQFYVLRQPIEGSQGGYADNIQIKRVLDNTGDADVQHTDRDGQQVNPSIWYFNEGGHKYWPDNVDLPNGDAVYGDTMTETAKFKDFTVVFKVRPIYRRKGGDTKDIDSEWQVVSWSYPADKDMPKTGTRFKYSFMPKTNGKKGKKKAQVTFEFTGPPSTRTTVPLFKFYSESRQDTMLTTNPGKPDSPGQGERALLNAGGYVSQGIVGYVFKDPQKMISYLADGEYATALHRYNYPFGTSDNYQDHRYSIDPEGAEQQPEYNRKKQFYHIPKKVRSSLQVIADIHKGSAGYKNTLGFYLANQSGPQKGFILEPNAKDSGALRRIEIDPSEFNGFEKHTMGFFLIPDGADYTTFSVGQEITFSSQSDGFRGDGISSAENNYVLFSDSDWNPDNKDFTKWDGDQYQYWEDLINGDDDYDDCKFWHKVNWTDDGYVYEGIECYVYRDAAPEKIMQPIENKSPCDSRMSNRTFSDVILQRADCGASSLPIDEEWEMKVQCGKCTGDYVVEQNRVQTITIVTGGTYELKSMGGITGGIYGDCIRWRQRLKKNGSIIHDEKYKARKWPEIGTTLFGPFSVAEGDTLEFEVVSLISGPPTGLVTMEMSFFDTNTKMFEDTFSLRLGTHSVPNEQSKEVWGDQGGGAIDTLYMQMYSRGKGEWYAGSPDGESYNNSTGTLVWDHGNGGRTPTGDWNTNLMGRPGGSSSSISVNEWSNLQRDPDNSRGYSHDYAARQSFIDSFNVPDAWAPREFTTGNVKQEDAEDFSLWDKVRPDFTELLSRYLYTDDDPEVRNDPEGNQESSRTTEGDCVEDTVNPHEGFFIESRMSLNDFWYKNRDYSNPRKGFRNEVNTECLNCDIFDNQGNLDWERVHYHLSPGSTKPLWSQNNDPENYSEEDGFEVVTFIHDYELEGTKNLPNATPRGGKIRCAITFWKAYADNDPSESRMHKATTWNAMVEVLEVLSYGTNYRPNEEFVLYWPPERVKEKENSSISPHYPDQNDHDEKTVRVNRVNLGTQRWESYSGRGQSNYQAIAVHESYYQESHRTGSRRWHLLTDKLKHRVKFKVIIGDIQ